jgi:CBS domain-containing protein
LWENIIYTEVKLVFAPFGDIKMLVKDIMTKDVICAEVPARSEEALNLIIKHNVTGLPVIKKGTKNLMGIISKTAAGITYDKKRNNHNS